MQLSHNNNNNNNNNNNKKKKKKKKKKNYLSRNFSTHANWRHKVIKVRKVTKVIKYKTQVCIQ